MSGKCFVDGCGGNAPWGLRWTGPMRDVPAPLRHKYLWHCEAHRDEAQKRLDEAMVKAGWKKAG